MILVAGGIGLAPLRPVIYHVLRHRSDYGRLLILYGTRTPRDVLFRKELAYWVKQPQTQVLTTVDSGWTQLARARGGGNQTFPLRAVEPITIDRHDVRSGSDDALCRARLRDPGRAWGRYVPIDGTEYEVRARLLRPLPVGAAFHLQRRARLSIRPHWPNDGAL